MEDGDFLLALAQEAASVGHDENDATKIAQKSKTSDNEGGTNGSLIASDAPVPGSPSRRSGRELATSVPDSPPPRAPGSPTRSPAPDRPHTLAAPASSRRVRVIATPGLLTMAPGGGRTSAAASAETLAPSSLVSPPAATESSAALVRRITSFPLKSPLLQYEALRHLFSSLCIVTLSDAVTAIAEGGSLTSAPGRAGSALVGSSAATGSVRAVDDRLSASLGFAPSSQLPRGVPCVLAEKLPCRKGKDGRSFGAWRVVDLGKDGKDAAATLYLFDEALAMHYDVSPGTILVAADVAALPPSNASAHAPASARRGVAFSARRAAQVVPLGPHASFGHCRAVKRDGTPCRAPVDLAQCPFCIYHAAGELARLRKGAATRGELAGGNLVGAIRRTSGANPYAAAAAASHVASASLRGARLLSADRNGSLGDADARPRPWREGVDEAAAEAKRARARAQAEAEALRRGGGAAGAADRLSERLARAAARAGARGSATGARMLDAVADPEGAALSRAEAEARGRAAGCVSGRGAPAIITASGKRSRDSEGPRAGGRGGVDEAFARIAHARRDAELVELESDGEDDESDGGDDEDAGGHQRSRSKRSKHGKRQLSLDALDSDSESEDPKERAARMLEAARARVARSASGPQLGCSRGGGLAARLSGPEGPAQGADRQPAASSLSIGDFGSSARTDARRKADGVRASVASQAAAESGGARIVGPASASLSLAAHSRGTGSTAAARAAACASGAAPALRRPSPAAPPAAAPSRLAAAFGSAALPPVPGQTAALFADAAQRDLEDRIEGRLCALEKQDALHAKLDGVTHVEVRATRCRACGYLAERPRPSCRQLHPHALCSQMATKRFWKCESCHRRFATVGVRYPRGRCPKCDDAKATFKAVSMARDVAVRPDAESNLADPTALLERGLEQKWVSR